MTHSVKKITEIHLQPATPLRLTVWWLRRTLHIILGHDFFNAKGTAKPHRRRLRRVYLRLDELLVKHMPKLQRATPRAVAMKRISEVLRLELGYRFNEVDVKRPWGGYFRITNRQIDRFLDDFFPGHSKTDARMGTKLSPKIMVVLPGQRFSWQYHERRAERWHFLTPGIYWRSEADAIPEPIQAKAGEVVQFEQGERHRGGAPNDAFVLIAEIWQHNDSENLSDEADVYRVEDDYHRPKHPRRA